jgi:uncharacterized membrane protein HdeD (DUF308 family)
MLGRVGITNEFHGLEIDIRGRMPAGLFFLQGASLMVLGLLAAALPHVSTLAFELMIGALLFIGGVLRTGAVLRARQAPGFWWSLTTALLATLLGLIFLVEPAQGSLTLTVILIGFFIAEGLGAMALAVLLSRHIRYWPWTLLSGLVDLMLAYLIWQGWPDRAAWAIGLLVGINLFCLGLALVMIGAAVRAVNRG